jgi:hypothetical protein
MSPPLWVWALPVAWLVLVDIFFPTRGNDEKVSKSAREKNGSSTASLKTVVASKRLLVYLASAAIIGFGSLVPWGELDLFQYEASSVRIQAGLLSNTTTTTTESEKLLDLERVHNATLGFEKVYVVNLPERSDKRDALSLIAALTGIKLHWTRAIKGSNVPDKALPIGVTRTGWHDGGIGSWRSQMNVIRR